MDLNTLKENSLFPVGEENTAFAAYFDGTSYLNMLTTLSITSTVRSACCLAT